jgi:hypothetical protein
VNAMVNFWKKKLQVANFVGFACGEVNVDFVRCWSGGTWSISD